MAMSYKLLRQCKSLPPFAYCRVENVKYGFRVESTVTLSPEPLLTHYVAGYAGCYNNLPLHCDKVERCVEFRLQGFAGLGLQGLDFRVGGLDAKGSGLQSHIQAASS